MIEGHVRVLKFVPGYGARLVSDGRPKGPGKDNAS